MRRISVFISMLLVMTALMLGMGYHLLRSQAQWQAKRIEANGAYQRCTAKYKKYRSLEQYHAQLHLPYRSPLSQDRWAQRFNTLHTGMSEEEVEKIMEAPDYFVCDLNRTGTRFTGSIWNYAISVQVGEVNYKKNSWIDIFFDESGRIRDKVAINVKGIPNPVVLQESRIESSPE